MKTLIKIGSIALVVFAFGLLARCGDGDSGAGPEAQGPPITNDSAKNAKPVDDGALGGAGGAPAKDGAATPPPP